uniref:Uncharacterized protein n=1 Tax=Cannabis sativa TaxID=3483 RepID=A0A803Q3P9_CANSA
MAGKEVNDESIGFSNVKKYRLETSEAFLEVDDVDVRWEFSGVEELSLCGGGLGCYIEKADVAAVISS